MITLSAGFVNAQAPEWLWAKSAGGIKNENRGFIAEDASNNIYFVGDFHSTSLNFGSTTLLNTDISGYNSDLFITKYDENGNLLWAKSAGGLGEDYTFSIDVDELGNIYVLGLYSYTIVFDTITLINPNALGSGYTIFLAKFNTNGNVLWAKSAIGTNNNNPDTPWSVAIDSSGNAYIVGYYGSDSISFDSITLMNSDTTGNSLDLFIAKYNSIGNVLWAKSAGGTNDDIASSVAINSNGSIIIAGEFASPTISFDTSILTNINNNGNTNDLFIAKYDANGNALWAKSAGGNNEDFAYSIESDSLGNSYMIGFFKSISINFSSTTLTNVDNTENSVDFFITKYDASGNVLWAKSNGGLNDDIAYSIALDTYGNPYIFGAFVSPVLTFGSTILSNADATGNSNDLFVTKYDISGNVVWSKSFGGTNNEYPCSVIVSRSGNTYVSGEFYSPTFTLGACTLTNMGSSDVFLAKLDFSYSIKDDKYSKIIKIFPNPSSNYLIIKTLQKATIEILNIQGKLLKILTTIEDKTCIDVSALQGGVYIIKLTTAEGSMVGKFIKE